MHDNGFAGALIVQINAFPVLGQYARRDTPTSCDDDQPQEQYRAVQWLTTPLEGLAAARERSMSIVGEGARGPEDLTRRTSSTSNA